MRMSPCVVVLLAGLVGSAQAQLPQSPASGAVGPLGPTRPTTATTAVAPAEPRVRELRCRGGGSGLRFRVHQNPSPRVGTYVTMALRYPRSRPAPAGSDWRLALDPGTCSWHAPEGPEEPGEVFFDTPAAAQGLQMRHGAADRSTTAAASAPDTASIPRYLSDPAHFWTFYVYDAGEQVAISHGAWQPSLGDQAVGPGLGAALPTTREGAIDPTRRADDGLPTSREQPVQRGTSRLGDSTARPPTTTDITSRWRIRRVSVQRESDRARIRFLAGPSARVLFSIHAPARNPGTGRWHFETDEWIAPPRELSLTSQRRGSAWEYATETPQLTRGLTYHYLIETGEGDRWADQETGSVRTLWRDVRVMFEELHVIDDADDGIAIDADDAGEIAFGFSVHNQTVVTGGTRTAALPRSDWSSGDRRRLPRDLTLVVPHSPDKISIGVLGEEDDRDLITDMVSEVRNLASVFIETSGRPLAYNQSWAGSGFDLSEIRSGSTTIPFTLRAPRGKGGLQFEVSGRIEVNVQ